jgi:hypothetical protein
MPFQLVTYLERHLAFRSKTGCQAVLRAAERLVPRKIGFSWLKETLEISHLSLYSFKQRLYSGIHFLFFSSALPKFVLSSAN